MASTLNRYREASSETFKCIHAARSFIKSRRFGKSQKTAVALRRFESQQVGLRRVFWQVCKKRAYGDLPVAATSDNGEGLLS